MKTIECYEPVFDEHSMPRPVVRDNDPAPWVAAVRELLTDPVAYQRESLTSRTEARRFVGTLDAADLERYLTSLEARPDTRPAPCVRFALADFRSSSGAPMLPMRSSKSGGCRWRCAAAT